MHQINWKHWKNSVRNVLFAFWPTIFHNIWLLSVAYVRRLLWLVQTVECSVRLWFPKFKLSSPKAHCRNAFVLDFRWAIPTEIPSIFQSVQLIRESIHTSFIYPDPTIIRRKRYWRIQLKFVHLYGSSYSNEFREIILVNQTNVSEISNWSFLHRK